MQESYEADLAGQLDNFLLTTMPVYSPCPIKSVSQLISLFNVFFKQTPNSSPALNMAYAVCLLRYFVSGDISGGLFWSRIHSEAMVSGLPK